MENVYDILQERGFLEQVTDAEAVRQALGAGPVACYVGFDPTAASLHVGHLLPVMALMHLQASGHRPIALVGGGTGLIGDPSGKTEMRQILSRKQIDENARAIQGQLSRYLDFTEGGALLLNNADWLEELRYIPFLRDIGRHFSVNRMLSAESYRLRLEKGLNFIEFNYMLLQAYDFLHLYGRHRCLLQLGGNDQWGNILAGVDLIRRIHGGLAHGVTFPLITTAAGHKMGKTEKGAVWLDAALTRPYAYYQFWVNTEDADVERFLALFTLLPIEEIHQVRRLAGQDRNMAKTVLAFEATRLTHGEKAAVAAWEASVTAFHAQPVAAGLFPSSAVPRVSTPGSSAGMGAAPPQEGLPSLAVRRERLAAGIPAFELFEETGLCASRGEARRLLSQGGGYVNERQIRAFDEKIGLADAAGKSELRLRKGKKTYFLVRVV